MDEEVALLWVNELQNHFTTVSKGTNMQYKYNRKLVSNAQELRKNMTPEEKHLWYDFLKKLPVTVNRQKNIGNYIVDFYIPSARLVIEIDGIQHKEEENLKADKKRDRDLISLGNKVLRFSNFDVRMNFMFVCRDILQTAGIDEADLRT